MIVDMYVLEEQDWSGNWGLSWNHLLVLKYQFSFPCPYIQGDFFHWYPLKSSKYRKGVSRPIYVNVDSPNLGFPYFNFLGGTSLKKHPVSMQRTVWHTFVLQCLPDIRPEQIPDLGFVDQVGPCRHLQSAGGPQGWKSGTRHSIILIRHLAEHSCSEN